MPPQTPPTPSEALQILDSCAMRVQSDRAGHLRIIQATATLQKFIQENTPDASHNHPADAADEHPQPEPVRDGAGAG